jgi:hypothetical protein
MKTIPLTLKDAALAWAQEKHVEVLSRAGWCRILKPGERSTKEEANKCWTSFAFYDATYPDSGLKKFRLVEEGEE